MEADFNAVKVRSSYNVAATSFTPREVASEISRYYEDFLITCKPDFRQKIADGWPGSIDDSDARNNWGWSHSYDLEALVETMIANLKSTIVFD